MDSEEKRNKLEKNRKRITNKNISKETYQERKLAKEKEISQQ